MDLVRTVLLYMMMLVNTATGASPSVTPIPASALPTPTPYVTQAPTNVPTIAPTAAPKPTRYNTLYVGDKGSAVRALQNRLRELGYLTGNADGSYGAQTKTAVENFQRANGLKVDGIAGRNTQQIMFESPDVVYARAATRIPTMVPVTATPIAPAVITVRYMDASTGALIRQTTIQSYADTNVYADASMVPATYRLVSNNYVSIRVANGQASPATVTFYYQRGSTATPNIGVSVPVYYLDSTNLIIARETRTLYQSGAVAADTSLIPAGYTLTGSSVVYVTLSGSTASPNPILFRLNRNVTPTPAPAVVVPVYYVNSSTGRTFASENITLYASSAVYPKSNLVPSGYTLTGSSYVNVTISNGRANPSSVTFRYQPVRTATPVVNVIVPITYLDASTNRVVFSTTVSLRNSQYVYADLTGLSGYTLAGAGSTYVTVQNGQANPASVTFRLNKTVTPTPIRQIALPVRYMYGSRLIGSQTVYVQAGTTSYVYADSSVYGSNYVISGSSSARVSVTAAGVASPSVVTFYVVPKATEVPSFQVSVPVRYQYGTQVIANRTVSVQNGTTATVYADSSVYSSNYVLTSDSAVRVTVSVAGVASPSVVVFYLTPKATEVPSIRVRVPVRYQYGTQVIANQSITLQNGTTTTIQADPSVYSNKYTLISDPAVTVTVSLDGTASPSTIIFYLTPKITPTPTAVPISQVPVTVRYMSGSNLVASYQEMCNTNATTTIYANPTVYEGSYTLNGNNWVNVQVDRNGRSNPPYVTFNLTPIQPVTPVPSFAVAVPVEYRYGNQVIYSSVVMLESGTTTTVQTDPSIYSYDYVLNGSDRVTVTVSSDGYANPSPIVFNIVPIGSVTPQPEPQTPTAAPPSGNKNQTLTYQEYSWSGNYDVYQGPGEDYYRQSNAKFGGGKARIYGTDGEWLLIGYGTSKGDYHIGYVHNYKLPSKAKNVKPVVYAWLPATVKSKTEVTTDPVSNMKKLETLSVGTKVNFLAWASDKHRYALIEYVSPNNGQTVRAFTKGGNLTIGK